ncbi:type III secretion apparatus assembly chaperone SctY [Imhoffiella purpurea]|uniref:Tetratricopeptide repeat protein n=1 Tax=Imhoffiella purpurea TaxID=1249627 RepID=W9V7T9_9GAMM|nr:tetratricopeptide repeat protein [Imhoffiella purpurea]EXJ15648.1 tetratricopeptide repeat protein [Imhoffiella purpurea]
MQSEDPSWSPERTEALRLLADVYLGQEQIDKALILLRALARLAPEDAGVWRALGYASLRAGQAEEALVAADTLLGLDAAMPANAPVLLLRALALRALGRAAEAQDGLRRYLELSGA